MQSTYFAPRNVIGWSQKPSRRIACTCQLQAWAIRTRNVSTHGTSVYKSFHEEYRRRHSTGRRRIDGGTSYSTRHAGHQTDGTLRFQRLLSSTNVQDKPTGAPGHEKPFKSRESWQLQKSALKAKFPTGWQPRKRLSPDAIDGIRTLHAKDPEVFKTAALAEQFKVSPEAVRRILKSKWRPSEEEQEERKARWERRGEKIWSEKAAQGFKMPKKWRAMRNPGVPKKPRWRNMMQPGNAGTSAYSHSGRGSLADKIG